MPYELEVLPIAEAYYKMLLKIFELCLNARSLEYVI